MKIKLGVIHSAKLSGAIGEELVYLVDNLKLIILKSRLNNFLF